MKIDQLKQIIREIVVEEIKKSLPTIVPQIVANALLGQSNPINKSVPITAEPEEDSFFESLKSSLTPPKPVVKQQVKKYSNNPVLNAVLNETQGGVPQENSYGVQLPKAAFKQPSHDIPVVTNNPILNETTKAQAELGVFKDYRKLMKAVDTKKKSGFSGGSVGGLSIEGGVTTDFTQTD
jgi:hypothetical protein